jgi:DNA-binding response OmpR family regulator
MGRQILVIDDEENIRFLYKDELLKAGYKVVEAGNGIEGFEVMKTVPVDLIILDIRMPEMDGLDFLSELRKTNKTLPVILCTAYGQHKQDLASWAAERYIIKSSDLSNLLKNVKELLPIHDK